ncbi:uncharacterized protein KY384_005154 [Bacidia gigantensis]|uniref:uncharacterized protein n=1 Tax=Bacidia gigantensis TaxID=2732470 RepID=UPI001D04C287|nr:uncharacterized protein KY384_005154 [Bacidia gigantensis]KAG8529673.1 hypothetical protein KY384_005154 [Bacidia gigantensis]
MAQSKAGWWRYTALAFLSLLVSIGGAALIGDPITSSLNVSAELLSISNNSLSLNEEVPPENFFLEPRRRENFRYLGRLETWVAVINCIGTLGFADWNGRQALMQCPRDTTPNVGINVLGQDTPAPPYMMTKHMMWSMVSMAAWSEDNQVGRLQYGETNFRIKIGASLLGGGSLFHRSRLPPSPPTSTVTGVQTSFPVSALSKDLNAIDDTTLDNLNAMPTSNLSALDNNTLNIQQSDSSYNITMVSNIKYNFTDDPAIMLAMGPFVPSGPILMKPFQWYFTIMDRIIVFSELDAFSIFTGDTYYDGSLDFTIDIQPISESRGGVPEIFRVGMVLQALTILGRVTNAVRIPDRYRGYQAVIIFADHPLGKMRMFKGRTPPPSDTLQVASGVGTLATS